MNATLAAEEVLYRPATLRDVSAMAQLQPENWGRAPDWELRLASYLSGEYHPRHALLPRVMIIAEQDDEIIGFIAGHLTRRFHCQGELQWINVSTEQRRHGIATEMLHELGDWFAAYNAHKVCVDAQPRNADARAFYTSHGAQPINDHWLIWPDIARMIVH
jgi:GNAT superfamily N-acetyltransferase